MCFAGAVCGGAAIPYNEKFFALYKLYGEKSEMNERIKENERNVCEIV